MAANSRQILDEGEWQTGSITDSTTEDSSGGGALHWMLLAGAAVTVGLFSKSVLDVAREEHKISRLQSPWKMAALKQQRGSATTSSLPRVVLVNSTARSTKALQRALRFFAGDVVLENRPRMRLYANCDAVRDSISLDAAAHNAKAEVLEAHQQLVSASNPQTETASSSVVVVVALREYVWIDGNLPDLFISRDVLLQRRGGKAPMTCAYVLAWTCNGVVAETITHSVDGTLAASDDLSSVYANPQLHELPTEVEHSFDALNPFLRMHGEDIEAYLGNTAAVTVSPLSSQRSGDASPPAAVSSNARHTRFRCDALMVEFVLRLRYHSLLRTSQRNQISSCSNGAGSSGFLASLRRWSRRWVDKSAAILFSPSSEPSISTLTPQVTSDHEALQSEKETYCVVLTRRDVSGVHVVARCTHLADAVRCLRQAIASLIREKHHRNHAIAAAPVSESTSSDPAVEDITAIVRLEYQLRDFDISLQQQTASAPPPPTETQAGTQQRVLIPTSVEEAKDLAQHASSCWMLWRSATGDSDGHDDIAAHEVELRSWVQTEPGASLTSLFGDASSRRSSSGKIHIRRVLYEYCV